MEPRYMRRGNQIVKLTKRSVRPPMGLTVETTPESLSSRPFPGRGQ
jgi:hypothetical protein